MATLRQIAANQRNAQRSTGPRTEEGKAASRRNALQHGLTGQGVVVPDDEAEAIATRRTAWAESYPIRGPYEAWLFEQLVIHSVRVDRCQREAIEVRAAMAQRARLLWNDDRRLAAEETAARLERRPSLVAGRLRTTRHGCDWLLARWRELGQVLEHEGSWNDEQISLAFDLLGTHPTNRAGDPWPEGSTARNLVRDQVEALAALQSDALDALDESQQALASRGVEVVPHPMLTRLRRYESAAFGS
ncbi:MAG: hypothetical protein U0794_03110 [Isosphaeraceae bacterium]